MGINTGEFSSKCFLRSTLHCSYYWYTRNNGKNKQKMFLLLYQSIKMTVSFAFKASDQMSLGANIYS